ncbi:uncharacterized protein LOC119600980 [Lucilia sericata]|uniref:uncharacterized protein LOC119600980 n=1 Tax=Lucilia sericata TaxID=13632 RepID=UPI0018A85E3B|nr:uncharacterized protein LOC119600980 [Lucilia sericata]
MFHFTSCIILLLSLLFCAMSDDEKSNCVKPCPLEFKPICATIEGAEGKPIGCSFENDCFLEMFTCVYGKKEIEQKPEICPDFLPECKNIIMRVMSAIEFE